MNPSSTSAPPSSSKSDLKSRVQSLQLSDEEQGRRGSRLPWVLCVVLFLTSVGFGYLAWYYRAQAMTAAADKPSGESESTADTSSSGGPPSTQSPNSTSKALSPSDVALQVTGYIVPARQILVSPKISGMVTKLTIEEGMRVKKGDVLAEIEKTEYQAEVDRAVAAVEAARQQLLELERGSRPEEIEQARAELAESEERLLELKDIWLRVKDLAMRNAATEEELTTAERQFKAQQQRVERMKLALELLQKGPREERKAMARAQLAQAEADLERARWRLDNCIIRAPISGTILKKNAEEGNIVNPVAFNGSFSVCDMADLSDMEVELDVDQRDIRRVFPGQKCQIVSEAYRDRVYEGFVSRLLPIADRANGSVSVRVKIKIPPEEEGVYLKPEMTANVVFLGAPPADAPAAPATSPAS